MPHIEGLLFIVISMEGAAALNSSLFSESTTSTLTRGAKDWLEVEQVLNTSLVATIEKQTQPTWGYCGNNGPSQWVETSKMCGGKRQSPVSLLLWSSFTKINWPRFRFINYDQMPSRMIISNDGHTVKASLDMESQPKIRGGGLNGEYQFLQFHIHWGSSDSKGSEHTFGRKRFPSEIHLVHYSLKYGTPENAVKHSDGLAVLGIMVNSVRFDNARLNNIVSALDQIRKPGSKAYIRPFPLSSLLPKFTNMFFRYEGSLTTPPCSEVVVWTVFKYPILASFNQLARFRQLLDSEGQNCRDNFRDLQRLNGRKVYFALTW